MNLSSARAPDSERELGQYLDRLWYGPENAVCARLHTGGECGIFGDDCDAMALDSVALDGLPGAWKVHGVSWTAAQLPCGHNFHISMLALHFLASDMRCPLCRAGPAGVMYLQCVPRNERQAVRTRLRRLERHARHAEDMLLVSQLGAGASREIEAELRLVVTIQHCGGDNARLAHVLCGSVLVPGLRRPSDDSSHDALAGSCFHLTLQRNFVRHVLSRMRRLEQKTGQCTVQFTLEHPLFDQTVSTRIFSPCVTAEYPLIAATPAGHDAVSLGHVSFDTAAQSITAGINCHCVRALLLASAARD